ncbi:MAG: thioredoxin family protein [Hymenobacteraceae bacterium]|nr:thioredoxin family protein [Hymenobacteraceae bacterium]MDX5395973.1 thioredoxin family protein [Hymenobacteraceae bacterium]MDX5443825.1 thioredoxin family protein [Hymenobacteraceae bacterium]MDX5512034.1 thioredoxin family protein [Hymenobacteraceae bacterium]
MAVLQASDNDFASILNSNQNVVVKYYADWCGNCRLFSPKFKRMSDDPQYDNITFVDVNAETSPEARKMAGVTNLPYFAVFKNGTMVDSVAASKEDAVISLIHKLQSTTQV